MPADRQKKLRNLPRRLRALRRWADSFEAYFPPAHELAENPRYWNWKLPTDWAVVEGRYATAESRREAAQCVIDACAAMLRAKPAWAAAYRVTCVLCVPDSFNSELCIYLDEAYYRCKVDAARSEYGWQAPIEDRSLATEWGLMLPPGMQESGVRWQYDELDPGTSFAYVSDHWMYGEVALDRVACASA